MEKTHKIALLGTGLVGMFYTMTLNLRRGTDRVQMVYSRTKEHARDFARRWGIPRWTDDMAEAANDPETDVIVIGIPNDLHLEAVRLAARTGKAVLCTKPLARTLDEAREMLEIIEKAGVFQGYLEDLVYTPKTLKAADAVRKGALGKILWVRSRETHPGPHSAWFWDKERAGGGAIVDMGCTASRLSATLWARETGLSRSCAGRILLSIRSKPKTTASASSASRMVRWGNLR